MVINSIINQLIEIFDSVNYPSNKNYFKVKAWFLDELRKKKRKLRNFKQKPLFALKYHLFYSYLLANTPSFCKRWLVLASGSPFCKRWLVPASGPQLSTL